MSRKITVECLPTVVVNVLNKNGAFNGSSSDWVMRFPFLGLRTSRFLTEYRDSSWPHACGHLLADAGHDTRRLQLWMGHSDIKHTARYSELSTKPFKDFWR
jgi:hypothetical protein